MEIMDRVRLKYISRHRVSGNPIYTISGVPYELILSSSTFHEICTLPKYVNGLS